MAKRTRLVTGEFTREEVDTGWTQVPHGLWTPKGSPGLTWLDRCVLGWLHSHTREFLEGVTRNQVRAEFGTSTTNGSLDRLVALGFLVEQKGEPGAASRFSVSAAPWKVLMGRRRVVHNQAETGLPVVHNQAETGAPKPAYTEDQAREDQFGSSEEEPRRTESDDAEQARMLVKGWWDKAKERDGRAPTALPFVAVVKIVRQLLTTWTREEVGWGLFDAGRDGAISVNGVELAIKRRKAAAAPRQNTTGQERDEYRTSAADDRWWMNDPMVNQCAARVDSAGGAAIVDRGPIKRRDGAVAL